MNPPTSLRKTPNRHFPLRFLSNHLAIFLLALVATVTGISLLQVQKVEAAVFNVNSLADILNPPAGVVTLRSAIQAANATPGFDTINLNIAGTYEITLAGSGEDNNATGDFDILPGDNLTIRNNSSGAVIIDGDQVDRVFDIDPGAGTVPFSVLLSGVTIKNGQATGDGGGIRAQGFASLLLEKTLITENSSSGNGGGVFTNGRRLLVTDSTISKNQANGDGGGIELATTFSGINASSITNSTIAGNAALGAAGSHGGGLDLPIGLTGDVTLRNNTITGNTATSGGGLYWAGTGQPTVQSTIIARNNVAHLYAAPLSGAEHVPATNSTATGTAYIILNTEQGTISYHEDFAGLAGFPTAIHLHNAPPGQVGPLAPDADGNTIALSNLPQATTGVAGPQTFTVDQAFVTLLEAGTIYTNTHNTVFPGGEIRGQFSQVAGSGPDVWTAQAFEATMDGTQRIPPLATPGTGRAIVSLSSDQTSIAYGGSFSGLLGSATAFHAHHGAPGVIGPLVMDTGGQPVELANVPAATAATVRPQTFSIDAAVVASLLAGDIYTNLHTTEYPGGEIRGQFAPTGSFTDLGFNLIGKTDGSNVFTEPSNLTGTIASPLDPGLELDDSGNPLLKNNGGPTPTILLLCGSPARDQGANGLALLTDQRGSGFGRNYDDPSIANAIDGTDIGAYEAQQGCNQLPVAKCKNIQVPAQGSCVAFITAADIDDGSFDPDNGDSIASRTIDNSGPLGLGPHDVMLTVTDTHNASSSCTATVNVIDNIVPSVNVSLVPIGKIEKKRGTFGIAGAASDNCGVITFKTVMEIPAGAHLFNVDFDRHKGPDSKIEIDYKKQRIKLKGENETAMRALLLHILADSGVAVSGQVELRLHDHPPVEPDDKNKYTFKFLNGVLIEEKAPLLRLRGTATDSSGNVGIGTATPQFKP